LAYLSINDNDLTLLGITRKCNLQQEHEFTEQKHAIKFV
jgi:hypothetical protein